MDSGILAALIRRSIQDRPNQEVKRDISAFLTSRLTEIRDSYNRDLTEATDLPDYWPSNMDFQTLVKMSFPLFIFAATACLFIEDRNFGGLVEQLKKVLERQTAGRKSDLDGM